ncbi:MAG TPA: SRPBCC family protein [Stellaceae bacterium]|nr:SRPBCC family protein [Stellaceae bacterium]
MRTFSFIILAALAAPAWGEVKTASPSGFEIANATTVKAAPDKVWDALLQPAKWWNPDHTYSNSAANLSLEPRIGGCFCETLPQGGGALHQTVVYISTGKTLGLRGPLGPLAREGAEGTLYWSLKPAEGGGTVLTQSYTVGGFLHNDGAGWAPKVDFVLHDQLSRLARYLDTGSPEEPKPPKTP